jgi:hypothetical protein
MWLSKEVKSKNMNKFQNKFLRFLQIVFLSALLSALLMCSSVKAQGIPRFQQEFDSTCYRTEDLMKLIGDYEVLASEVLQMDTKNVVVDALVGIKKNNKILAVRELKSSEGNVTCVLQEYKYKPKV